MPMIMNKPNFREYNFIFLALLLLSLPACAREASHTPTAAEISSTEPGNPTMTILPTETASPPSTNNAQPSATVTILPIDTPQAIVGMQVHQLSQQAQADLFYMSGAEWSRHDFIRWEDLEPENTSPENYFWERVDEVGMLAAVKDGRQTIVNIVYTPEWAQKYPGVACGPIAEDALDDFAEFMQAVVERYSASPYNIQYWEIGNEPDIDRKLVDGRSMYGCWGDENDEYYGGGTYAVMLKAIYPAIKTADPDAKVLVGGLVLDCDPVNPPESEPGSGELRDCTAGKFLEGILKSGGGDYLDGVSFHAYDYYFGEVGSYGNAGWHSASNTTGPVLIAKTNYLRPLLNTYGYPEKELLNTEAAVLCGRDGKEDYCQDDKFINTKAFYVAQANASALAMGLQANLWYSLTGWRGSGLVNPGLEPNDAFRAFQVAATQFNKAQYLGEIGDFPGVKGYQFERDDRTFWFLWSLDGEEHTVTLPSEPDEILDVYGVSLEGVGDVLEVNIAAPVYIQWMK